MYLTVKEICVVTTLFLVRHGENLANLTNEFSHRMVDYPLTDKGVLQAQQTADHLVSQGITHVFCSPLKRALQSAQIIGERAGLAVTCIEAFREVNVGILEGQPPTVELWQQHDAVVHAWREGRPGERFPGGENYHELLARARCGVRTVLRTSAGPPGAAAPRIVIVAHGGILSFTLFDLFPGIDPHAVAGKPIPNCSITELEVEPHNDGWRTRLVTFGDHAHLSGEAANLTAGRPARHSETH